MTVTIVARVRTQLDCSDRNSQSGGDKFQMYFQHLSSAMTGSPQCSCEFSFVQGSVCNSLACPRGGLPACDRLLIENPTKKLGSQA